MSSDNLLEQKSSGNENPGMAFWRAAAASVIGAQHVSDSKPCEDAWSIRKQDLGSGTVTALCVCDGAGSVKHGRIGARTTSRIVSKYLIEHFETLLNNKPDAKRELIVTAKNALLQEAARSGNTIRDYACTVVAAACHSDGRWACVHIGDGGVAAKINSKTHSIFLPMKGEFSNSTYFVTDKDAEDVVRCMLSTDLTEHQLATAFILFTDGVENVLINFKSQEMAIAAGSMMEWLLRFSEEQVTTGLQSQLHEVFRQRTGDDCTIGLLAFDAEWKEVGIGSEWEDFGPEDEQLAVEDYLFVEEPIEGAKDLRLLESIDLEPSNCEDDRSANPVEDLVSKVDEKTNGSATNLPQERPSIPNDAGAITAWNVLFLLLGFVLGFLVCFRWGAIFGHLPI